MACHLNVPCQLLVGKSERNLFSINFAYCGITTNNEICSEKKKKVVNVRYKQMFAPFDNFISKALALEFRAK
jgi:hypothetical protein